jgi:HlyD family secretion protein
MLKIKSLLKDNKKLVYGVSVVILIVFLVLLFNKNSSNGEQTITVKTGDFLNQISASGKVIPASSVELSFKNSGRIERIYFSVDELTQKKQIVKAGTLIAQIDTKDAQKVLHNAEINLEDAKLSLAKFKLESSNENLNTDLQKAYDDGFIAVSGAFIDLSPTITGLDNLLSADNVSDNTARLSGQTALDYKDQAEKLYYKAKTAFDKSTKNFRLLNRDSLKEDIEKIINETYDTTRILIDAIKSTKNLVDYLADDRNMASDYLSSQNTLYEYTNTINQHLSTLLTIKTNIKNGKDAFSSTDLDTQSLLLTIKQKENAVEEARNELSDYYIRAPFDGVITKIDAKVGEIALANTPLVSMMSVGTFQIESYIPEIHIAKIKLNDEASITLDAYGEEIKFKGQVVSLDPAETIRDGVSTYKVKLQFKEKDDRIKSGMTANVAILIFDKKNVIVLPGGTVFEKDSKKFVQVKENKKILEKEVTLGEVSSLGQVEIVSGVKDGDVVMLNPKIK